MTKLFIIVFTLVAGWLTTASGQGLSNKGKEFWVGYGHHSAMEQNNNQEMVLYLSAEQPANVTITINGTTYSRTYTIPANTVIATDNLPKSGLFDCRLWSVPISFGGTNSEGVFNRGVHIVSDVPIVAYAHIINLASSGATMLMPVETWGYSYTSVNFTQDRQDAFSFSWVNVIANHDDTRVQITPSVQSRNGLPAGATFTITLNKGQVYQLLGSLTGNPATGYDVTGTQVKSIANASGNCYPIAVLSGSSRTNMIFGCGGTTGDSYIQQVFPVQAWGKRYLTAPASTSTAAATLMTNAFRVVVRDPTTVVRRNGVVLTGLLANSYYQFTSNTADYITADKPILVAQYMASQGSCYTGVGDPEMFYISPIEQAISNVSFYRNNRFAIDVNYLTLIIPTAGVPSLRIDGSSGFDYSYPHPNLNGYTIVVKRWAAAQAQASVSSDSAFTAITYGLGAYESYGYNAGTRINNLNAIGEIRNQYSSQVVADSFTCRNTPFYPTLLVAYKPTKMVWRFSAVSNISPAADVTDNAPVLLDSQLVNNTWYYRYRLSQAYTFSDTGTYNIPIVLTSPQIDNCNNTEEVGLSVTVKTGLQARFTFSTSATGSGYTGCQLDTVYFTGTYTGNLAVNRYKWNFSTNPADTTILQNPRKNFSLPGTYNVRFTAISMEGCIGDTVRPVTIYPPPTASLTATPLSGCTPLVVDVTSGASYGGPVGIHSWYWNNGNNSIFTNTSNAPVNFTYATSGTYTIQHLVKVSDLCISDTARQTITVFAKPVAAFTYPQGCLPPSGIAQFNSTSTIANGQPLTYTWDFGDPSSGSQNTSALQNPTHNYTAFGNYNVKLTVATANGCTKDTTINITFSLQPSFAYPLLADICGTQPAFSIATATVTNGVPGTGYYRGPGTNSAGIFNPAIAGTGTHTIWYIFQTTNGCRDSISQTIRVSPKPTAAFDLSQIDFCADTATSITSLSTVGGGSINSWHWLFSDGTSAVYQNGAPFPKNFAAGTYTIRHFTISDSGCISDTVAKMITVHPLPVAAFTLPTAVCMPAGQAPFMNRSTVPGGGNLTYTWDFGDASTVVSATNPTHTYTGTGPYAIKLQAATVAGCKDDTTQVLSAFYQKSVAAFTVNSTVLCQGATNMFVDLSTTPGSSPLRWNWNFGDGSNAAAQNPSKRYSQPNTYTVSLTVENVQGCISDTFRQTVTVLVQPRIDAGPSFLVAEGTSIRFSATRNDNTIRLKWTPANGLSSDTILNPLLVARSNQVYYVTATGGGNCTATDSLTVRVIRPLLIPNAFSPNGDGINDTWVISNVADYANAIIELYDRYGKLVSRTTAASRPWNGTLNGSPLPIGTYYYVIDLKSGSTPINGAVTIIR